MNLASKRIMLTGGAGFLGSFVTEKLKARGCKHIFIPALPAIEAAFKASKPDVVIHLAYPFAPIPFKEEDLWNGYPEETNAPYGLAKKMLLVQSQAYRLLSTELTAASRALDEGISICKNILRVGKDLFDPGLTTARS